MIMHSLFQFSEISLRRKSGIQTAKYDFGLNPKSKEKAYLYEQLQFFLRFVDLSGFCNISSVLPHYLMKHN